MGFLFADSGKKNTMSRTFQFFADRWDETRKEALITGRENHHLRRVLRLRKGDRILVSSGRGDLYHAVIEETEGQWTRARLLSPVAWQPESPLAVTLVQAMPKRRKMEWILQKAVELGTVRIVPVMSEHSIPHLSGERKEQRMRRWAEIVREAARQSYRGIIPELDGLVSLEEALNSLGERVAIFCDPGGNRLNRCIEEMGPVQTITVIVGPEGGFSPEEVALARSRGVRICSLGPRVLRLETAVVKVLSILQYLLGDG